MKLIIFAAAASCLRSVTAQHVEQITMTTPAEGRCEKPRSVAIIGAGAAGTSAAYHLHKYAPCSCPSANITIFERNSYIGGRSTTVNAYDDPQIPVELGASIFVEVNQILRDAVKEFELSTDAYASRGDAPGAALAVWDGSEFVFIQNKPGGWWDLAKLLWKYGLAPVKTIRLMKTVVGKFLTMYDEPHFPFRDLTQVAQDVGLLAVTAATGDQYLVENGITGNFGRDIVQASTRVNYAQNLRHIHGLEAMVCMAAENAMAVQGGNWQIFQAMANSSKADIHLDTAINSLDKQDNGTYILTYSSTTAADQTEATTSQLFDSVIVAAPLQFSNITISPPLSIEPDTIPYVQLHVTLFASPRLLSPSFFNLPADATTPRVILTTLPPNEEPRKGPESAGSPNFFSISLLRPVTNPRTKEREYLYKIFSPAVPEPSFLHQLLGVTDSNPENDPVTWIYRKLWNSYPYEYPRVTFERIRLDDNLWYTSGIESFISTMETSALMGRNVARLILDDWHEGQELEALKWAAEL